jgi:hypothetical protein
MILASFCEECKRIPARHRYLLAAAGFELPTGAHSSLTAATSELRRERLAVRIACDR